MVTLPVLRFLYAIFFFHPVVSSAMKTEAVSAFETFIPAYQSTQYNIQEERVV
jgi:hypothetical protein